MERARYPTTGLSGKTPIPKYWWITFIHAYGITAQNAALANELTAVGILRRRMSASVLLIKALGGGWNVSNLPAVP